MPETPIPPQVPVGPQTLIALSNVLNQTAGAIIGAYLEALVGREGVLATTAAQLEITGAVLHLGTLTVSADGTRRFIPAPALQETSTKETV